MSKQLPAALLDLRKWDQLSREECVEVALQVERMLPLSFQFPQNTFGVQIADHSYHWELCMEPGILRGGDGGYTQCGWAGYFAHYLTYTSAFYQTYNPAAVIGARMRRVYAL